MYETLRLYAIICFTQIILLFVVLNSGEEKQVEAIVQQLLMMVREEIGAFTNFKRIIVIKQLPKTRSGKILRSVLRNIVRGEPYDAPPTIDDPTLLCEIDGNIIEVELSATSPSF